MPLPSTGTLSFSQINTELGFGSTANVNIGATSVRGLAGVPSGAISFSQLLGKANATASGTLTIATTNPTYLGFFTGVTGSITNSLSSNVIYSLMFFNGVKTQLVPTAFIGPAWATNPTSIILTMNGITRTMLYVSGSTSYEIAGNVFNLVAGNTYSWSYK